MHVAAALAAAAIACGAARAQAAAGEAAKPHAMAADADPDWEVVAVRPTDPNGHGGGVHSGREVAVDGQTVQRMLLFGCGLHPRQLVNAPAWTATERWDVKGIPDVPGKPGLRQMQVLVCKVLRERFGLVSHTERRDMAVYALTQAKGGPKMGKSSGDPNGLPSDNEQENDGQMILRVKNISMGEMALLMRFYLDRPVVDQTGLKGRFDFQLRWTTDEALAGGMNNTVAPGIFTAMQEQLGLKLEPLKTKIDVMVIDKVERPGAN